MTLIYEQRWRGGPSQFCYNNVSLEWTGCNYGGRRPWWLCPVCGRRAALLYSGRGEYSCRPCSNLAYRCQRETQEDLAARRANRVRDQLGWPRGVLNMPGGRPKGMHWKTYFRLVAEHTEHSNDALAGMSMYLERIRKRLGSIK